MTCDCIDAIPGAAELRDWFGGFPSFHDGYARLQVSSDGSGWIKLRAGRMTDRTDADGYFILEKHFAAQITLGDLVSVSLGDFMPGELIIGALDIRRTPVGFVIGIDTSYGLAGTIVAGKIDMAFVPLPAADLRDAAFPEFPK